MADRTTLRFPLAWPAGWPRTPAAEQTPARFHTGGLPLSFAEARNRLEDQLRRLEVSSAELATAIPLRLDGGIRRDARVKDTGVALYFRRRVQDVGLAADRFDTTAGNIAALAAYLEALRATERHGVGNLDRVFSGFLALPPPPDWSTILEQPCTKAEATAAFRRLVKALRGQDGTISQANDLAALQDARDRALAELPD